MLLYTCIHFANVLGLAAWDAVTISEVREGFGEIFTFLLLFVQVSFNLNLKFVMTEVNRVMTVHVSVQLFHDMYLFVAIDVT